MNLSKQAIVDFKKIYLKTRGKELTDEEADKMGWDLLKLAALTLRPLKNDELN